MKTTRYFDATRARPDRRDILDEWILAVVAHPVRELVQADGRIRRWAPVAAAEQRVRCVVLLSDGQTVHNAFFDRGFAP